MSVLRSMTFTVQMIVVLWADVKPGTVVLALKGAQDGVRGRGQVGGECNHFSWNLLSGFLATLSPISPSIHGTQAFPPPVGWTFPVTNERLLPKEQKTVRFSLWDRSIPLAGWDTNLSWELFSETQRLLFVAPPAPMAAALLRTFHHCPSRSPGVLKAHLLPRSSLTLSLGNLFLLCYFCSWKPLPHKVSG